MRKWISITWLALGLVAGVENAGAATDSTQLQVSVQVVPNCRILVTDLAFGAYDPLLAHATQPLDGTALLTVLCTKSQRASLLIDDGKAGRTMQSENGTLLYGIYSDSAHTRPWGSGAQAIQVVGTGSAPQTFTVYGRVPGAQVVAAGWYRDAVTATVDF